MGMVHYFRENFCVDTVGAEALDFVLDFPHIAQESALYAHLWQYVCPWDTLVLQFLHELEYWAYGFFALFDSSLLFEIPDCPNVADFFSLADEEEAGEPWYISFFFFTPGVARVVLESFWHLVQTMLTRSAWRVVGWLRSCES